MGKYKWTPPNGRGKWWAVRVELSEDKSSWPAEMEGLNNFCRELKADDNTRLWGRIGRQGAAWIYGSHSDEPVLPEKEYAYDYYEVLVFTLTNRSIIILNDFDFIVYETEQYSKKHRRGSYKKVDQ